MFYTLKHTNIGDESYSFETTAPPFSKKREGRLAKVACTNCRISKLKCSADPHGCQRCVHKKIKCQYPSAPRSYVQKKTSSSASSPAKVRHARQRSLATTVDTTVSSSSSSSASSEDESLPSATTTTVTSPVLQQQQHHHHHHHHHNESTTTFESSGSSCGSSSNNSQQELGLFFDMADFITTDSSSAANTLLSDDFMDMDQLNAMVPWHQQPFTFSPNNSNGNSGSGVGKACAPWNDMPELDDIDFSSGSNTASSSVTPLPATPSVPEQQQPQCSCFVQAVGTHESIEVARWGLKELSGDVDEILQQLNKALVECEELLECRRCNVQPSYVMLLLNMCSKMLASLEDISIGTSRLGGSSCHPDRSITTSSSSTTTSSSASSASSSMFRSADGKRRRCASDGADRTGENNNNSNESRRREIGISIRNWQLDDDDEHLVLQSLIRARVARLERLLGMLGRVVSENSWPAHGGMMRELQGRLTRGAFGGGVVGGAGGLLGGNPAWGTGHGQGGLGQTLF